MFVALVYHELNKLRTLPCSGRQGQRLPAGQLCQPSRGRRLLVRGGENCLILTAWASSPVRRVGNNVSIWNHSLIGHHAVIGDDVWIAAGATIGGGRGRAEQLHRLERDLSRRIDAGCRLFVGGRRLVLKSAPDKSVSVQPGTGALSPRQHAVPAHDAHAAMGRRES